MTRPCVFGLGVLVGAIAFPCGYRLAFHIAGHHYLSINLDFKEN